MNTSIDPMSDQDSLLCIIILKDHFFYFVDAWSVFVVRLYVTTNCGSINVGLYTTYSVKSPLSAWYITESNVLFTHLLLVLKHWVQGGWTATLFRTRVTTNWPINTRQTNITQSPNYLKWEHLCWSFKFLKIQP